MLYRSCRSSTAKFSFTDAVLSGWAPCSVGGMVLPCEIPLIPAAEQAAWRELAYPALARAVLAKFAPELPWDKILPDEAYARFSCPDVVALRPLPATAGNGSNEVSLLELYHGPSLAFKDLGMMALVRTMAHLLRRRGERRTVIVGTSGDTGPAALEAVRDCPDVLDCVVLYPRGRVSAAQELQMLRRGADVPRARVVACEGSSDDLDVPCAAVLGDPAFAAAHGLATVNSVNVLRLLAQVVHYWYAGLRSAAPPRFVVPTGAGGHLVAGLIALRMGLPVANEIPLLAATNQNDGVSRFVRGGGTRIPPSGAVLRSASNAMDIAAPYNLERLLALCNADPERLATAAADLASGRGTPRGAPPLLERGALSDVGEWTVAEGECRAAMRDCWEGGVAVCPHTAVGVAAAAGLGDAVGDRAPVVVMGCAHPSKFPEALAAAGLGSVAGAEARAPCGGARELNAAAGLRPPPATAFEGPREGWEAGLREIVVAITKARA